nr:hypothetical protein LKV13_04950 [Borrelia sp. BU AG58]
MKKINVMFYLILAVLLASCDLFKMGSGQSRNGNKTGAGTGSVVNQVGGGAQAQPGVATSGSERSAAAVFANLKGIRDSNKKDIADAKREFDALAAWQPSGNAIDALDTSRKNEIRIPPKVTGITEAADQSKIHASLGYDSKTNYNLNKVITALYSAPEINMVSDLLKMLVDLDEVTNKILNELLKDENLEKIKNDKTKLEKAEEGLGRFIVSRRLFIRKVQKAIQEAKDNSNISDAAENFLKLKEKLKKITAKDTSSPMTGDAGYYHFIVEAIKANAAALEKLIN